MECFGELNGRSDHQQIVKSPVISIADKLVIDLEYNDEPVTVYYKSGNLPWQSILMNNVFKDDAIPRGSDIYLSALLNRKQKVRYSIKY